MVLVCVYRNGPDHVRPMVWLVPTSSSRRYHHCPQDQNLALLPGTAIVITP